MTYGDSGGWFFEAAFSVCGKLLNVLGNKKGAGKSTKATNTMIGGEGVNCAKSVAGTVRKAHYMVPEKPGPFFFVTQTEVRSRQLARQMLCVLWGLKCTSEVPWEWLGLIKKPDLLLV